MSIFFIVSGMNLDVYELSTVGVIGFSYFIVRIIGKYMGTYVSCLITNTSMEIRNFMGLALIPQAGVAIGLAFLGQRLLPPETGNLMLTIILSSSVLYEMIGPISAKLALIFSGSIPSGYLLEALPQEGEADENSGAVTAVSLIPASERSQKDGESFAQIVEELNAGVDERDDDIESAAPLEEQKEKKKKSKKKKKREKIVEIPLEENVWAEGCE